MGNSRIGLRRAAMCALSLSAFVICTWVPNFASANNNIGLKTIPFTYHQSDEFRAKSVRLDLRYYEHGYSYNKYWY